MPQSNPSTLQRDEGGRGKGNGQGKGWMRRKRGKYRSLIGKGSSEDETMEGVCVREGRR